MRFSRYILTDFISHQNAENLLILNPLITGKPSYYNSIALLIWVGDDKLLLIYACIYMKSMLNGLLL